MGCSEIKIPGVRTSADVNLLFSSPKTKYKS